MFNISVYPVLEGFLNILWNYYYSMVVTDSKNYSVFIYLFPCVGCILSYTTIFINSLYEWPSPTLRTGFKAEVSYNISKPYQVLMSQSIPCSDKDQWFHILSPSLSHRVQCDHLPQTFTLKPFFLLFLGLGLHKTGLHLCEGLSFCQFLYFYYLHNYEERNQLWHVPTSYSLIFLTNPVVLNFLSGHSGLGLKHTLHLGST